MPYYAWKGVTLTGALRSGHLFARSEQDLDRQLFACDIALLASRAKKLRWWHRLPVDSQFKIQFFRQLALLSSSGIFLSEALTLMSRHAHSKPRVQEIMIDLVDNVQQGIPLSVALAAYPHLFDKLMIQMAHVGGDTGTLAAALNALCDDLEMKRDLRTRVRSAVLLPSFTFLFFMGIATVLVVVVLPRFAPVFSMYGADLPWATTKLLALSDALRGWAIPFFIVCSAACIVLVRWYARSKRGKQMIDGLLLRLPFVGDVMRRSVVASMLRAIAMLMANGMSLVNALHTVGSTVDNTVLQKQCFYIEQQVIAGAPLSQAMQQIDGALFDQELIAAVRIGESSANLPAILTRTSDMYYEQVKNDLIRVTTLLNPCLTIILGLMITALIVAVYLPIFSLSHVVG